MLRIFEWITEAIGWFRIVLSPFLIGLALGAIVYFPNPSDLSFIIGVAIATLGLIIGIIWATSIYLSKGGTVWFLSRTMASPDLDEEEVKEKEGKMEDNNRNA